MHLPDNRQQLRLLNIDSIAGSEQAFAEAFLATAQVLHRELRNIQAVLAEIPDFTTNPFNLAILGLFAKMSSHYYSCVQLEVSRDRAGSKYLIEHLFEAAITLTYLLEEGDEALLNRYISASVSQARYLLLEVKEQLQEFPNHPHLSMLQAKLQQFIDRQQSEPPACSDSTEATCGEWQPQTAETTAKRATVVGLDFLLDPARQITLKVVPASWLELQLNYFSDLTENASTLEPTRINFTHLRDATHLCLHATHSLLQEVVIPQDIQVLNVELQQQKLNLLYEWFYNAHHCYQWRCGSIT